MSETTIALPQPLGESSLSQLVSALEAKLEACVQNNFTDLSLSLSEVISAEDNLVKAARVLRSMRNVFAPINKLPPEILTHICTFTSDAISSDFAHLCAQICRTWRNTLLASPSLWNEIYTEDPLHVDVHLTRSARVPLDVYVCEGSPVDRICRKVVPHMDRVRLLSLSLLPGDHERILDSLSGGPEMMVLRHLCFRKSSIEFRLSAPMMERISSLGVNITDLTLYNVDTHLSSITFPSLRYFSHITEGGFEGPRVSDMVSFLRGHPMLEELELNRVNYSDADGAGAHIEPAALQHLKIARLGGRPSSPTPDSLLHIDVDLLPYLLLPTTGQCNIWIIPVNTFPRGTSYLLTLIHAREIISGPGGGFGAGSGLTEVRFFIEECPSTLNGQAELWIPGWGSLCAGPHHKMDMNSRSWLTPDWETTTTDEDPRAGETGDDEFQAQLSRLGCYLDALRRSPSPLTTVEILILGGFGYTTNKGKYLQYLRECFRGLNRVREFQVEKTNPRMVVRLLQPFEGESGGMVLLFPLLQLLIFSNCTSVELPRPRFLEMMKKGAVEVMKKRAALGNVLEGVWVDDEEVDLSEPLDIQERT